MNFYLRYFDDETLVHNIDDAIDFLADIDDIVMTPELEKELRDYAVNNETYPKRCKVRARIYFIVIKTEANTLQDFKDKKALKSVLNANGDYKTIEQQRLHQKVEGWYEGCLDFKRVVVNHLGKCEYRDTTFIAQCKASSGAECYERIVEHLKERVDNRSQFPSAKGKSFSYRYLGQCK